MHIWESDYSKLYIHYRDFAEAHPETKTQCDTMAHKIDNKAETEDTQEHWNTIDTSIRTASKQMRIL